jgi:SAM-dependent methyltransferase
MFGSGLKSSFLLVYSKQEARISGRQNTLNRVIFPPPIYTLIRYAEKCVIDRAVLDCGAGGRQPPLALFSLHGYETCGIDISDSQIKRAKAFASKHGIALAIRKADMRSIPFNNDSFGCVYSWNSSIHLTKKDTEIAISEMLRVLKDNGLLFVDFIWYNDLSLDLGEERNPGEFWMTFDNEECVHSCFHESETDRFLANHELLYKQKRQITTTRNGRIVKDAYLDYIIRKRAPVH